MSTNMYGATRDDTIVGINTLAASFFGNANMALMSILSDVQEMIARPTPGNLDAARQYLNRVKLAIMNGSEIKLWQQLALAGVEMPRNDEARVEAAVRLMADAPMSHETPGVAEDLMMDQLIRCARGLRARAADRKVPR